MSRDDEQAFPEDSGWQEEPTAGDTIKWSPAVNVAAKNWKSWFAFSKMAPMPAKWWKKDFALSPKIAEKPKKEKEQKIQKPIPKISDKKKKRMSEEWTETDLFAKVWSERPHVCVECGKELKNPKPHNFDHIIPKSRGKAYRLDPDNIQILCFWCHYEKTTLQKYKWIDLDR